MSQTNSQAKTKKGQQVIAELVIVGNWIKSCKNQQQLDNIDKFLNRKNWEFPATDSKIIMFHYGVINGMLLTIEKRKAFKK